MIYHTCNFNTIPITNEPTSSSKDPTVLLSQQPPHVREIIPCLFLFKKGHWDTLLERGYFSAVIEGYSWRYDQRSHQLVLGGLLDAGHLIWISFMQDKHHGH